MKVIKRVALPQPNTINCNMISLVMETPGWVSRVGLSVTFMDEMYLQGLSFP